MNTIATETEKQNIYLIEFYTCNPVTREPGWDIHFAWVHAKSKEIAVARLLQSPSGATFDVVIKIDEHAEIVPLTGPFRMNCRTANLFIIQ